MRAFYRLTGPFGVAALTLLAGFALMSYVQLVQNYSGRQIKSLRVYERGFGFYRIETKLLAEQAPVRVLVDMTTTEGALSFERTELTVTATTNSQTVLAETVEFFRSPPKKPQIGEEIDRQDAGMLSDVSDGVYVFTVRLGAIDEIKMQSVDLVLRAGAMRYERYAMPIGITLVLLASFAIFVLRLRYGNRLLWNPPPPPPTRGSGG